MTRGNFIAIGYSSLGAIAALLQRAIALDFSAYHVICNRPNELDETVRALVDEGEVNAHTADVCREHELIGVCQGIAFNPSTDVLICLQDRPTLAYLKTLEYFYSNSTHAIPIPCEGIRNSRLKAQTRLKLDLGDVPNTRWALCKPNTVHETIRALSHSESPYFYIKPIAGMGSELVRRVSANDLENSLTTAFSQTKKHFVEADYPFTLGGKIYSANADLLIEEEIYGPEYTVDGYILDGEVIAIAQHKETRKTSPFIGDGLIISPPHDGKKLGERIPDETGYELSHASTANERELIEYCEKVLKCLDIDNWVFHMEVIDQLDRSTGESLGPRLVEINPRVPGGLLARSFLLRKGVNLVDAALNLYLDLPIDRKEDPCVTGQFPIYWEKSGIQDLRGLPKKLAIEGLEHLHICEKLEHYPEGQENYLAFAMIKCSSHDEVRLAARKTFEAIKQSCA